MRAVVCSVQLLYASVRSRDQYNTICTMLRRVGLNGLIVCGSHFRSCPSPIWLKNFRILKYRTSQRRCGIMVASRAYGDSWPTSRHARTTTMMGIGFSYWDSDNDKFVDVVVWVCARASPSRQKRDTSAHVHNFQIKRPQRQGWEKSIIASCHLLEFNSATRVFQPQVKRENPFLAPRYLNWPAITIVLGWHSVGRPWQSRAHKHVPGLVVVVNNAAWIALAATSLHTSPLIICPSNVHDQEHVRRRAGQNMF